MDSVGSTPCLRRVKNTRVDAPAKKKTRSRRSKKKKTQFTKTEKEEAHLPPRRLARTRNASKLKTMRPKVSKGGDDREMSDGRARLSSRSLRRSCRAFFLFFLSALLFASARAAPSSTRTKEKNEERFTILRAEKWPLGNGGVRIYYSSSEKEERGERENNNTVVELSLLQKEEEEEEEELLPILLESAQVIATKPSSSSPTTSSFYSLGTTTVVLAPSDGVISQEMLLRVARLVWARDIPDAEKIAVFALRLTPELVVDYTSNDKVHILQRLKEYGRLDVSSIASNTPFRLFSLRRVLGSMPPDGLKTRLHHDIVFVLDDDSIENKMFVEKARALIKAESSSAAIFVSSLVVDGGDKGEDAFTQWFGKFVKKRREERTYVAAACGVSHEYFDNHLFGRKMILSPVPATDRKSYAISMSSKNCRVEEVLRGPYPYFDTITLKMDFTQRNEFEGKRSFRKGTYDERIAAKKKFSLTVRFENAKRGEVYEEREAIAKFHGTSTFRDCERRKSMKINLRGDERIKLGVDAESDQFLLISLCYDDRYVKSWLMYSLLRHLGLFEDLAFRYVRLFVETNNVRESEGLYLLVENPVVKRRDVKASISAVVRRRLDPVRQTRPGLGAPDVKYPKQSEFDRAMKRNEYDEIARVARTCDDISCYELLRKRMNVDAYIRWIAFNSLVKMGDYVDEIYFYSSNENQHTAYWGVHGWDPDDAFQKCHHGGKDAHTDRFQMLYCLEGNMDIVFLRSKDMYSRFVQTLEELLARNINDQVVISAAEEQKKELNEVLNINNNSSNDDVSIGMLELNQIAKIPNNMAAFREMSNSLLYYIEQIRLSRRELFRVVGAYHSFFNDEGENGWKSVRVSAAAECASPLKLRVSERTYDRDARQEIVFEFDNLPSRSDVLEIEIPLDLNVVYKFNETYAETYLPVPVEKETRALCWTNATLPGDIINMNATDGGFLIEGGPKKSCIAGEAVNVSAKFTNEAVTFTMKETQTNTTRDKIYLSIYHGFWHPFFKAFADAKYARILKC